jgi:hypothetical protein
MQLVGRRGGIEAMLELLWVGGVYSVLGWGGTGGNLHIGDL